jgi:hypothetical protein
VISANLLCMQGEHTMYSPMSYNKTIPRTV